MSPIPAFSALAFDGDDGTPAPGWLHPAAGPIGVVLCASWGYEELCTRRSWTALAQAIAAAGFPCLRYDAPGVADALDGPDQGLVAWTRAAAAAARALRRVTGVGAVVMIGQGLGAVAAYRAAGEVENLAGLALLAPPVRGQAWLRELKLWEGVLRGASDGPAPAPAAGVTLAGFAMPQSLAADVAALDLTTAPPPPARPVLLLTPSERTDNGRMADRLAAAGARLTQGSFTGHAALLTDPTRAQTPDVAWKAVVDWLAGLPAPDHTPRPAAPAPPAVLRGMDFVEEPVRFGPLGLVGVVCRPLDPASAVAAVLLNGGRDPHTGWARSTVAQARALARAGVTTLRIDAAGLGDSPPRPGAPDEPLYSPAQVTDVGEALDMLQARGLARAWLVGRCSGAFTALETALIDLRVEGVIAINPLRLIWNPDETVAQALADRPLETYARVRELRHLTRIMRGEVNVAAHLQVLARRGWKAARDRAPARAKAGRLHAQVHARFAGLRDRGVTLAFVHSEGDGAQREFARYLGPDAAGRDLARAYPNISLATVPDADHNLTSPAAQTALIAHLIQVLVGEGR